jgi:hypothetical protein
VKSFVAANGRWVLAGLVLVVVGLLVVTGLGKRRGTRLYRWRVGLWVVALGLMGGVYGCAEKESGGPGRVGSKVSAENPSPSSGGSAAETDDESLEALVSCYQSPKEDPREEFDKQLWEMEGSPKPVRESWEEEVPVTKDFGDEDEGDEDWREAELDRKRPSQVSCYLAVAQHEPPSTLLDGERLRVTKRLGKVDFEGISGVSGGEIDEAVYNKYLRARSSVLLKCYLSVARKNPEVAGKLVLKVRVKLDGRATAKVTMDKTGDPSVATCVIRKLRQWAYPEPMDEDVEFELPLEFKKL